MSESESDSAVKKTVRTVTPYYRGRPDEEMNLIGFTYFLVLLVLLVPLLPFILIVWVLTKILDAIDQRAS